MLEKVSVQIESDIRGASEFNDRQCHRRYLLVSIGNSKSARKHDHVKCELFNLILVCLRCHFSVLSASTYPARSTKVIYVRRMSGRFCIWQCKTEPQLILTAISFDIYLSLFLRLFCFCFYLIILFAVKHTCGKEAAYFTRTILDKISYSLNRVSGKNGKILFDFFCFALYVTVPSRTRIMNDEKRKTPKQNKQKKRKEKKRGTNLVARSNGAQWEAAQNVNWIANEIQVHFKMVSNSIYHINFRIPFIFAKSLRCKATLRRCGENLFVRFRLCF